MAIIDLQDRIVEIVNREDHSDFLYELLDIYDIPRATITRLKSGNQNLTKRQGEVHLKNKVWFKKTSKGKLFDGFVELEKQVAELAAKPRYLLVTDFGGILAKDTKTQEALDIKFEELPQYFDFFLAWKGIEKVDFEKENPADIKAAERFARLYDVLRKENNFINNDKGLDLFLIRLLFCFFAEDTDIFKRNSFTNSIKTLTEEDGSNLNKLFTDLFRVLDETERNDVPSYLREFPYVNGQLFTDPHEELNFSTKSRKLIIECGELLNWGKINPDIFGSMIQAVATEESRSYLGMHYTSVPNIMKVINPLFLDELNRAYFDAYNDNKKLEALLTRISKIKFFDPACGSGNFLIIAYKEMRRLEIKIIKRLQELLGSYLYVPSITLSQYYGIEIDDFAHDVAKLSLWIAEHQMNVELKNEIHNAVRPTLPLSTAGDIRCANALRINWDEVCPHTSVDEVYIFGNPPYLGAKKQRPIHKEDLAIAMNRNKYYKKLDYICGWFFKGNQFILKSRARIGFVSTNSISQGEQVYMLWPEIFKYSHIHFAYTSFKWNNNAKNNAGVTVVIIGLESNKVNTKRRLFTNEFEKCVENINGYLVDGKNIFVSSTRENISGLPKMVSGSMPRDGGHLIFSLEEYEEVVSVYPSLRKYFKKYVGANEFINSLTRYVLWLNAKDYHEISDNPVVKDRISRVIESRLSSPAESTREAAKTPYMFVQRGEYTSALEDFRKSNGNSEMYTLLVPKVSSENRDYVPMGIVGEDTIVFDKAMVVYNPPVWLLGILQSRMHMVWFRAIGGRLETRYQYSSTLVYNTFAIPELSIKRKKEIENAIFDILDIREEEGSNLASLYSNKSMPKRLLEAHQNLDNIVESSYRNRQFKNDEERLETLLNMYQKMTKR